MKNIRMLFLAFAALLLVSCGMSGETQTGLLGSPSTDGNVKWLRNQFQKSALVKNKSELNLDAFWTCRQRSAIKGSTHTSRFWQIFFERGTELVGETTFFLDQREKMIGLYGIGQNGARGSLFAMTDRYQVPYESSHLNFRKMADGNLIVEWTTAKKATVTGRNFSFVPELVTSSALMEGAIVGSDQGAFAYAICEKEKPQEIIRSLDESKACEGDVCTLFKIKVTKHTPDAPVGTRTTNKSISYGSVQHAYYDTLTVAEGVCFRYVQLPRPLFKVVSSVVSSVEKNGAGSLTATQKNFLEFYRSLSQKADEASCVFGIFQ